MPKVPAKQDWLMTTLTMFYRRRENLQKLLSIIQGKSRISLRLIDWFVTNYSKNHNIMFTVVDSNDTGMPTDLKHQLIVHTDYKSQLKAYSKKFFDPFCRGESIEFQHSPTKSVFTTVGQLNFFRWVIENQIIGYIDRHFTEIEEDMTACMQIEPKPLRKSVSLKTGRKSEKKDIMNKKDGKGNALKENHLGQPQMESVGLAGRGRDSTSVTPKSAGSRSSSAIEHPKKRTAGKSMVAPSSITQRTNAAQKGHIKKRASGMKTLVKHHVKMTLSFS